MTPGRPGRRPRCHSLSEVAGRYFRHCAFRTRPVVTEDTSAIFRKTPPSALRSGSTAGSVSLGQNGYPGRRLRHRENLQPWPDPSEKTASCWAGRSLVLVAPCCSSARRHRTDKGGRPSTHCAGVTVWVNLRG
ncbi:AbfB domain-containing protein [Streptomyces sp. NPDC005476]|uniref:AbfB domain-containing protein n=1 Tax=Streptomyces sp. NPDC005476 TaxID=3156882 RepID=UPI0034526E06